jgi:histidinol-phosphate phosphatase family protein
MKAVILAGGKGTRMGTMVDEVPKPMLLICSKPVLEYQIELLKKYEIREIIIIVNHLKKKIIEYFGNGSAFGVNISYYEETEPLGTVGGIKAIENQITEDFMVLYGDVLVNMNLNRLVQFHFEKKGIATLVVHPNDHPHDSDLLDCDKDHLITGFYPKPHEPGKYYRNLVNAALYIFNPKLLDFLTPNIKADFGKDIFPSLVKKEKLYAYNTPEYLKDMGTPGRIQKVENDLKSGLVEAKNLENKQIAVFLDRDGVVNKDSKEFIKSPDEFLMFEYTSEAIKKVNKSNYLSIICTNQSGLARNLFNEDTLKEIHNKFETLIGKEGAKVDAIYYCPHHPDSGFEEENKLLKIDCECRKPKPGMLVEASRDFNIDLSKSYMIGDSERDILAGKAAGCMTIGVRTGNGLKNTKTFPDYIFNDLKEAVDFITDDYNKESIEEIITKIQSKGSKKCIVLIGGNTRSGKSTIAKQLQFALADKNFKAEFIRLDDWIMPLPERTGKETLEERFNFAKMQIDIQSIIQHQAQYNDVIIVEGVPALNLRIESKFPMIKVFMKINPEELKKRIYKYYTMKGLSSQEIEELYQNREADEYQIIANQASLADIIIG